MIEVAKKKSKPKIWPTIKKLTSWALLCSLVFISMTSLLGCAREKPVIPEPGPVIEDPEPEPEPDPIEEPEPEPEPEPDPEPEPEPIEEPDPEPEPEPEPEPKPDPKPEPKPDPKPDPEPEPKPDPKPDPEPEPEPDYNRYHFDPLNKSDVDSIISIIKPQLEDRALYTADYKDMVALIRMMNGVSVSDEFYRIGAVSYINAVANVNCATYSGFLSGDNLKNLRIGRVELYRCSAGELNRPAVEKISNLLYEQYEAMGAGKLSDEVVEITLDNMKKLEGFVFEGESLNTSAGPVKYSQLTVMEKFFAVEVLYVHYDNIYIADSFLGTTYYNKAQTKRCVKRRLELRDKLYANQLF